MVSLLIQDCVLSATVARSRTQWCSLQYRLHLRAE